MKNTLIITIAFLFCGLSLAGSDNAQIRSLRAQNNQAIANEDLDAIVAGWQSDIQVTISSGGHLDGADAYIAAFESVFESIPGINFQRNPHQIKVSEDGMVASEQGHWVGTYPGQAVTQRTGTYMAVWRKDGDGQWLIAAEVYAPLASIP